MSYQLWSWLLTVIAVAGGTLVGRKAVVWILEHSRKKPVSIEPNRLYVFLGWKDYPGGEPILEPLPKDIVVQFATDVAVYGETDLSKFYSEKEVDDERQRDNTRGLG